ALVALAEHVQRRALVDRLAAIGGGAEITRTGRSLVERAHGSALGVKQLDPADDLAGRAVDDARGVDHGVGGHRKALAIGAAFAVLDLDLAVGVADVPVDVLNEAEAVVRATQAGDVAGQFTGVVLGPVGPEHA